MPGRAASRFEPDLPHNTPFQYRDLAGCLRASHRARLCLRRPSKMLAGRLRHKARILRASPRARLTAESCFEYFFGLGEFVAFTREPNIERRQNKDAHCQVDDQASDDDDREGSLRIGADGM